MTPSDPDSLSRELIRNDLDTNYMVEAAAGTGKTTCIVERMVNLIATGKCEIENLVAVTFTRKAAAELRERFHASLREETHSTRPVDEISRLSAAIDKIEYAFVATFHSFCSLLLRERPIECHVEPAFREMDEAEDWYIRDQAWHSFLSDLYSTQDVRLDRMNDLGLKTSDLKRCLDRFADFPDVDDWPHDAPAAIDLDLVKEGTRSYIEHMRALSPSFPVDRQTDKLMTRYENIVRAADNADWRVDCEFFDLLELFDTTGSAVLKWWRDKDVAKAEKTRFANYRFTAKVHLHWWHRHRYQFVVELLQQARNVYDRLRRASGGLNYQDLLLRVAAALRTQPNLRAYFQRRFSHLLVDEFQDTDPVQAEILTYLTSENHGEDNWQRCVPKPGSLFLVGDPKQSIYRFRRADIVTYNQVKDIFESSGGRILTLSKNFRSESAVLQWINPVFQQLFAGKQRKYSPVAIDMLEGREEASANEASANEASANEVSAILRGVHQLRIPDGLFSDKGVDFEADLIARYISACIASKKRVSRTARDRRRGKSEFVEAGDFLIVARRKKHLHVYADALNRYGVKSEESGGNAFQNIEELDILVNCLRAVDDARNPIPYVAVLRGPLFGFSDADLYELQRTRGHFSYSSDPPAELAPQLRARYLDVNERLTQYRLWFRNMPFAAAFARVASDLGLLARCSSHADGNMVVGGFLKAIEWVRSASWDFDSATDVITYLEDILGGSETDGCNVLAQAGSSVRIMNLHKAKGLEAPIVFLANPYGMISREPDFHVDRSGEQAKGYLAIKKPKGQYQTQPLAQPSDWEQYQEEERKFEEAEETRLLYVGCTRAASQLVISVVSPRDAKNSPWGALHEHLQGYPALEVPTSDSSASEELPSAPTVSLDGAVRQLEQAWSTATAATYHVRAAKTAAMESRARPVWRASGDYGEDWGSAIHALLDARMRQPHENLDRLASQLAEQYDLGSKRVAEMLATTESVASSEIWSRAQRSPNVQTEVSFESASTDSNVPTITRGVIDLCFEEVGGWVVVDYKTDGVSPQDAAAAIEHYRNQLEIYAKFWAEIIGRPVIETGIYFTKLASYRTISPP